MKRVSTQYLKSVISLAITYIANQNHCLKLKDTLKTHIRTVNKQKQQYNTTINSVIMFCPKSDLDFEDSNNNKILLLLLLIIISHMTLRFVMLHHHSKYGNKMFCDSKNIFQTNIH